MDIKSISKIRIPAAGEKDLHYIPDLKNALNKMADKGKGLDFAGKGHINPVNQIDQQFVDYGFKEERAARLAKEAAKKAKEAATDNSKEGITKAGKSLLEKIKDNPVPYAGGALAAALAAGVGAAALRRKFKKS